MSEPKTADAAICPQCGSEADWSKTSWCASCGYYPAIGRLVETPDCELEEQIYENWWEAVPTWLWVLSSGIIGIFILSVGVRVIFAESAVRLWWTILQLTIGVIALGTAHLMAYLHSASRSDRIGPLDAFMKPFATWQPVLMTMPQKSKMLYTGVWGLMAIVTAFFVIDGIDYQAIAEARQQAAAEDAKKKTNPVAVIIKSAQTVAKAQDQLPNGNRPESMEEALNEFAGGAGVDELEERELGEKSSDESGDASTDDAEGDEAEAGDEGSDSDSAVTNGDDPENGDESQETSGDGSSEVVAEGNTDESEMTGESEITDGSGDESDSEDVAATAGDDSESSEEPPVDAAASADGAVVKFDSGKIGSSSKGDLPEESIECVVIGYTTNAAGEPRSLLLAAPYRKRLVFVAKVSLDQIDEQARVGLQERLTDLRQRWPVTSSPFGGRWIKPQLFCQVRFAGWSVGGRLSDPYITRIAVVTRPADASVNAGTRSK